MKNHCQQRLTPSFVSNIRRVSINFETLYCMSVHISHANKTLERARTCSRGREPCEKSNNRHGRKRGQRSPGVARSVEFTEARYNVFEVISAAKGQLAPFSSSRL